MELNKENLLIFFKKKYSDIIDEDISFDTNIREGFYDYIDGDDAIEMLELLANSFNVEFNKFDFRKYFFEEIEISRNILNSGLKKLKNKDVLTLQILYDFMKLNELPPTLSNK